MNRVLPVLWISTIYFLVVVLEGNDPTPPWGTWERTVYEAWHTSIHAGVFALQVWLTANAVDMSRQAANRDVAILIGLGTLLGLGIEILQASRRPEYVLLEGVWDMFSDLLGAGAGWLLYKKSGERERKPVQT